MRMSDWSSDVCSSDLAAPRTQLDIAEGGAAGTRPQVGDPDADHLAEHLADLGRGNEIARGAERVARRVIMRVRGGHIVGDRRRPRRRDFAYELVRAWRDVTQRCRVRRTVRPAGGGPSRSARTSR